ncbi:putative calcium-binding protein CML27 [Acorus calamus]|uniref:Calcium-binding protein CML27 n=1 Tax=Acorus calamus TaxID=4465 RepID=A0AAV9CCG4_ACOCL|nr:putative calcium-binding protein CML27 [Acorus calamus]
MEGAHNPPIKLSRPSPSFRLRTQSLDTLRLRRIFDVFDRNGDGEITVDELGHAMETLGLAADASELQSAVADHIKPGRSGLEFEDFRSLHRSLGEALFGSEGGDGSPAPEEVEESDLSEAFRVFDEDGDGFISARELQTVLGKLGFGDEGSIDRVHQMICSVDSNHDGRVDFGEFKHMMQGISVIGA